jgi:hypothetical protein
MKKFRVFPWMIAGIIAVSLVSRLDGRQQPKASGPQVEAAYLYNFGRFVTWPATLSAGQFGICILGEDPFGAVLDSTVSGETIDGKQIVTVRISNVQGAQNCRILFISPSEDKRLKQILAALDKSSILTVSDMPEFVQRGGMIQFVLAANKVRFEVNLATAEEARLQLSSELLKVAAAVKRVPSGT